MRLKSLFAREIVSAFIYVLLLTLSFSPLAQAVPGDLDTTNGLGGNDVVCGAGGNDTVTGGSGNDRLDRGNGTDRCDGVTHINGDTAVRCESTINVP